MGGGQRWTAIQKTWKRRDWREHPIARSCPRLRKSCPWSRGAPAPQPASSSCLRCAYQLVWESEKCSKGLSHCPEESPVDTAPMSPGGCPSTRERALGGKGAPTAPPTSLLGSVFLYHLHCFLICLRIQRPREGKRLRKVTQQAKGPEGLKLSLLLQAEFCT